MEASQPVFIYDRSIDVNRNFDFDWNLDLNFPLNFNRFVDVNRFVYKNGFVDYNRLLIYRFLNKNRFFDDLGDLDLFHYYLRNFFLYLYVFRDFNDFLYDSLGTRYILWHLNSYLYRFLKHHFFNSFFRSHSGLILSLFLEHFDLHLHLVVISLQFVYDFLMLFARNISP